MSQISRNLFRRLNGIAVGVSVIAAADFDGVQSNFRVDIIVVSHFCNPLFDFAHCRSAAVPDSSVRCYAASAMKCADEADANYLSGALTAHNPISAPHTLSPTTPYNFASHCTQQMNVSFGCEVH